MKNIMQDIKFFILYLLVAIPVFTGVFTITYYSIEQASVSDYCCEVYELSTLN